MVSLFASDNLMITTLPTLFVILVLLIVVIQGSIWINFSFPTLMEQPVHFLNYLIVQSIQSEILQAEGEPLLLVQGEFV